jgi:hypothetical protein
MEMQGMPTQEAPYRVLTDDDRTGLIEEAERRLRAGVTDMAIVDFLGSEGLHRLQAFEIVGEAATLARRKKGKRRIVLGAIVFSVGALVTVGTYLAAGHNGVYVVAFGALIVGAVQIVLGIQDSRA